MTDEVILARQELEQYREIREQLRRYDSWMDRNRMAATSTAAAYSGMPSGGGMLPRPQRMLEEQERIVAEQAAFVAKHKDKLDAVESNLRQIRSANYFNLLQYVYAQGMRLKEAAVRMGYAQDTIKHMHRKALTIYAKIRAENA